MIINQKFEITIQDESSSYLIIEIPQFLDLDQQQNRDQIKIIAEEIQQLLEEKYIEKGSSYITLINPRLGSERL